METKETWASRETKKVKLNKKPLYIPYCVIEYDGRAKDEVEPYDIMPRFIGEYNAIKKKDRPETYDECLAFIERKARHYFWSRCEHEFIISSWPPKKPNENGEIEGRKVDKYFQIAMNIELVTLIFMNNVGLRDLLDIREYYVFGKHNILFDYH